MELQESDVSLCSLTQTTKCTSQLAGQTVALVKSQHSPFKSLPLRETDQM